MDKRILLAFFVILGSPAVLAGCTSSRKETSREPIIFSGESGSIEEMDVDDLILQSNLIAIGKFNSIPPSRWNTPDGTLPNNATWNTIHEDGLFIYTEQVFQPSKILKIDPQEREILVRSFGGQVGDDIMTMPSLEVEYTVGQDYLLFLSYYPDRVEDETPGYYVSSGAYQGMYTIVNDRAISKADEWLLNDLVEYIQGSELAMVNMPSTPETMDIIRQIERAFDIESGCDFDFSLFPSVYMNDPRYPVDEEKLEFIRMATDNSSLKSAGHLDYRITYHSWWLEGKNIWEEIYYRARAENREITEEESRSFLESKWGKFPGGYCAPKNFQQTRFISIVVERDIATVVLGSGMRTKEFTLIFLDENWLIAQEKEW